MQFFLFIFVFFAFYLSIVNFSLKKFNISLDKELKNEKHKFLLRKDSSTPLSGTFYFLPIILLFFHNLDLTVIICCILFFILGFVADLKIVTSYKSRLIYQFLFFSTLFFLSKDIKIFTWIEFIDDLMKYELLRIFLCTFFFMVLINGFNLIDGTNCLCSLNFLIISVFIFFLMGKLDISYVNFEILIIIIALSIFVIFNFFGKNFLGDGAAYGMGFLLGYILLNITLINYEVSPYFIANLLWYPAFENLFSIIRRNFLKKNNYLPDNGHLHHLIFKVLKRKKIIKRNFLLSSIIGLSINFILSINYLIGYYYYNHTAIQVLLIFSGIFFYLIFYYILKKKLG